MSLQNKRFFRLITVRSAFRYDNVLPLVLNAVKSPLFGKLFQIIAERGLIARTMRYLTDFFKKMKNRLRLQTFQYTHLSSSFFFSFQKMENGLPPFSIRNFCLIFE